MAIKVVIVEDNPATVRSLVQTIDWAAMDCVVEGTANDGESGRQLILRVRPDIVLTDIRMPQKDGLEMLEDIKQELPDCKSIIITGYDQFQYASRAIKLSVFDYILKPIDNEEVEQSVQRAAAMTKRGRENSIALEQAETLRRRAQLLSLLTNDSQRGQGVYEMLNEVGLDFSAYYIMVVQLQSERVYSQATLNRIDSLLNRYSERIVTLLLYDAVVIFAMRDDQSDEWRREASQISDILCTKLVNAARIGVSQLGSSRHAIRQAYQQARQALWEIALRRHPMNCNFFQNEEDRQHSERIAALHHSIDELLNKADLSDASAAEAAHVIAEQSGNQYSNLRAMVTLYVMSLRKKFPYPSDEKADAALYETWFVSNEEDTRDCLSKVCAALREARDAHETATMSLLTRNALQYIRLHAIEGLSLNDVADKMCVSANYLSALIRKETGVTFHEHVLTAKMEVARTMLADPRILVEEVAHAVGYGNYISFYNAFKRIEHMTPTEYRNRKVSL